MDYIKAIWKSYLKKQKENILDFSRDMYNKNEIDKTTLEDVYFKNFITNK